ncbi:hypothetical protein ACFPM7_13065 [Actinokineospora guangxiensis]|uniref:Uncharacterized protein n=1 Tax=Actinokineospora guangxiensis TaxID=1490288 RepID=A0ABW0EPQ0_9PSEU
MISPHDLQARVTAPGRATAAATALLSGDDERTRFWGRGRGNTTTAEFSLVGRWPREMSTRVR